MPPLEEAFARSCFSADAASFFAAAVTAFTLLSIPFARPVPMNAPDLCATLDGDPIFAFARMAASAAAASWAATDRTRLSVDAMPFARPLPI